MTTCKNSSDLLEEYQEFANKVQQMLREDKDGTQWETTYAGYAEELLENQGKWKAARKKFDDQRRLEPLRCYTVLKDMLKKRHPVFGLRFLGQSVGEITVRKDEVLLRVDKKHSAWNQKWFGCGLGSITDENWKNGTQAEAFRKHFKDLERKENKPRQTEHLVESVLLAELGKKKGATKEFTGIQPVTYVPDAQWGMKTALKASRASKGICHVSLAKGKNGGNIDIFCRQKVGNQSRLTVIEVKDENKSQEPFHKVIMQAIAYAVFIRELARSESGEKWMKLWGLQPKQWKEKGFIINAVAAMPKGEGAAPSFAGQQLMLKGPGDITDTIELHYIAMKSDLPKEWKEVQNVQDVRFETSLGNTKSCSSEAEV